MKLGIVDKVIRAENIVSCEPIRARMRIHSGVGLRLGIDSLRARETSFGNAVRIKRKTERPLAISTNRPKELSKIINSISP